MHGLNIDATVAVQRFSVRDLITTQSTLENTRAIEGGGECDKTEQELFSLPYDRNRSWKKVPQRGIGGGEGNLLWRF